jgi:hypothetical protein
MLGQGDVQGAREPSARVTSMSTWSPGE